MKNYLPEELYTQFLATYPAADIEAIWDSVFTMCDLFQNIAVELSNRRNFTYDFEMAESCISFLKHVQELPQDAKEVYP